MNPKIMMIKNRETSAIYTGIKFENYMGSNIFVIEETLRLKGQCLIEYSPVEFAQTFDVIMYRENFDLMEHMKKIFTTK